MQGAAQKAERDNAGTQLFLLGKEVAEMSTAIRDRQAKRLEPVTKQDIPSKEGA